MLPVRVFHLVTALIGVENFHSIFPSPKTTGKPKNTTVGVQEVWAINISNKVFQKPFWPDDWRFDNIYKSYHRRNTRPCTGIAKHCEIFKIYEVIISNLSLRKPISHHASYSMLTRFSKAFRIKKTCTWLLTRRLNFPDIFFVTSIVFSLQWH